MQHTISDNASFNQIRINNVVLRKSKDKFVTLQLLPGHMKTISSYY